MNRRLVVLVLATAITATTGAASAQQSMPAHDASHEPALGAVDFQNSCAPAVQAEFQRGVAMLHSYWFGYAGKTFRGVLEKDPDLRDGVLGHGAGPARQLAVRASVTAERRGGVEDSRGRAGRAGQDRARAGVAERRARLLPEPRHGAARHAAVGLQRRDEEDWRPSTGTTPRPRCSMP